MNPGVTPEGDPAIARPTRAPSSILPERREDGRSAMRGRRQWPFAHLGRDGPPWRRRNHHETPTLLSLESLTRAD